MIIMIIIIIIITEKSQQVQKNICTLVTNDVSVSLRHLTDV